MELRFEHVNNDILTSQLIIKLYEAAQDTKKKERKKERHFH